MEFQIYVWILDKVRARYASDYLRDAIRYESSFKKVKVDSLKMTSAQLQMCAELANDYYEENVPDKNDKATHNKYYPYLWLSRKIKSALELEKNDDGSVRVKALDQIPVAMRIYFKQLPHKVIFHKNRDGWMLPYVVTDVKFNRPTRSGERASSTITAKAYHRDHTVSISGVWEKAGKTCEQLLKEIKWVPETEELITSYSGRIERYKELSPLTGTQVNLNNTAQVNSWVPMTVDGKPTKAVIDDVSDEKEEDKVKSTVSHKIHIEFWKDQDVQPIEILTDELDDGEIEEDDTRQYTMLPLHPYIKCFDLAKHRYVTIHVGNITDYEWNHNLADKLILDQETKDLITILVDSTKNRSEDIISGKMSGTIVLATGAPGVGKTLTAEVFSEKIEKPLYVVQCSQLGIDIDHIEQKLSTTLDRASRWGAILLIDEADVYIRDRGEDIVHNAIVGVFLRLIEYYNGVLFMTSNRGDIIDDAIISRATAWIQYKLPDRQLLMDLWFMLSEQFGVALEHKQIQDLVDKVPNISGRTVRNLLKLVKALDYKEDDPRSNYKHIMNASKFQKLEPTDSKLG